MIARSFFFLFVTFGDYVFVPHRSHILTIVDLGIIFMHLIVKLIMVDVIGVARVFCILVVINVYWELDLYISNLRHFHVGIVGVLFLNEVLFIIIHYVVV